MEELCSVPVQPKNRRQSQVCSTHIPPQVNMLPKVAMRRDVLDWFHNSHLQAPTNFEADPNWLQDTRGNPLFGLYGDVPLDRVWRIGLAVLNGV